jgi:hypothetical protein
MADDVTNNLFSYSPLATEETLRLLSIDRVAPENEGLICTLLQVNRHIPPAGPSWITLSYRWGDPCDLVTIQLREITESASDIPAQTDPDRLYSSLQAPRSACDMLIALHRTGRIAGEWVWIDYICLNQQRPAREGRPSRQNEQRVQPGSPDNCLGWRRDSLDLFSNYFLGNAHECL